MPKLLGKILDRSGCVPALDSHDPILLGNRLRRCKDPCPMGRSMLSFGAKQDQAVMAFNDDEKGGLHPALR